MTGRRLYDKFCDSLGDNRSTYDKTVLPGAGLQTTPAPIAWPYLSHRDKRVWNNLAKRLTPTKRQP